MIITKDKMEIIEAINCVRQEMGLEPYSTDALGRLDRERLQELFDKLFEEREKHKDQLKKSQERTKMDFYRNVMIGLGSIIVLLVIISIVSTLVFR